MPTHYGSKPKGHQGGNGKLTQRQKDTLKRHAKHHTKSHLKVMENLMTIDVQHVVEEIGEPDGLSD